MILPEDINFIPSQPEGVIWAKTYWDKTEMVSRWLPLWQHLDDAGAVAEYLWDHWLSPSVRGMIAQTFNGEQNAKRITTFLAGAHDIGKATPAFAVSTSKHWVRLRDDIRKSGLPLQNDIPDRKKLPHGLASHIIMSNWLQERFGWVSMKTHQLAVIIGGHHGVPPDVRQVTDASYMEKLLGEQKWKSTQFRLLDRTARVFEINDALLSGMSEIAIPQTIQVLLTALVMIADWQASDVELFSMPLLGDQPIGGIHRIQSALAKIDLPLPWKPLLVEEEIDKRLRSRFSLPSSVVARPIQRATAEIALSIDIPGILVIEAPMGEGKTEAALLAAESLAQRSGASGCFVALPTQATTDAMFIRVLKWLEKLPQVGNDIVESAHSIILMHSKATLNNSFRDLNFKGEIVGIEQDNIDVSSNIEEQDTVNINPYVNNWTKGRKKGLLADFVVGTIDQLLFTSLKTRHLALRHLGVAGKVVILDEVHAYDVFMSVYLKRALEWLGAYGIPVILLSATLPDAKKRDLISAYQQGQNSQLSIARSSFEPEKSSWASPLSVSKQKSDLSLSGYSQNNHSNIENTYPLLTYLKNGKYVSTHVASSTREYHISLSTMSDSNEDLLSSLEYLMADGGCVLIVRNTVWRAQQTALFLRQSFGDDVRLVHSRFIGHHRIQNDQWLLDNFGAPSFIDHRAKQRPSRAIVVGTQVLEQSLDIDFDLLISDIAPIDLLLQRIGRLHRHKRGENESQRPSRLRSPKCIIVGVSDWDSNPPKISDGLTKIYSESSLLRSAALILEKVNKSTPLDLPRDIKSLVENGYSNDPLGPDKWQEAMKDARKKEQKEIDKLYDKAKIFLLNSPQDPGSSIMGWLNAGIGEVDDTSSGIAQVRNGDDSFEVILLMLDSNNQLRIPDGPHKYAGEVIPIDQNLEYPVAQAVAGCVIRLPSWYTRGTQGEQLIYILEHEYYIQEWQNNQLLRGQLILPIKSEGTLINGAYFKYGIQYGLEIEKSDRV